MVLLTAMERGVTVVRVLEVVAVAVAAEVALAVVRVLEVVALVAAVAVVLVLVYQDQEFPAVQIESMVVG